MKKYWALMLFLLVACAKTEKSETVDFIPVDPSQNVSEDFFSLVTDLEVKPIQGKHIFKLKTIQRGSILDEEHIILADDPLSGNFIIINHQGMVVNYINQMGDFPESYREVTCFVIRDRQIVMYDFQKQRLTYYNFNGNFIKHVNIGLNFKSMVYSDDFQYLFTAKHKNVVNGKRYAYDLLVLSKDSIVSSYLPFNPDYFQNVRMHSNNPFYFLKDKLLFNDLLSDTVFSVTQDGIHPVFIFHYTNKKLPKEVYQEGHSFLIDKLMNDFEYLRPFDFGAVLHAVGDDQFIFSYFHNLNKYHCFYNLKTKEFNNLSLRSDDINLNRILEPFFYYDGAFFTVVPFYAVVKLSQLSKRSLQRSRIVNQLDSLKDQINDPEYPFLIRYRINSH